MTTKTLSTSTGIKISIELLIAIISLILGIYGWILYINWQNGRDIVDQTKINAVQDQRIDKAEQFAIETRNIENYILILQQRTAKKLQVDTSNPLDTTPTIKNLNSDIYLPF